MDRKFNRTIQRQRKRSAALISIERAIEEKVSLQKQCAMLGEYLGGQLGVNVRKLRITDGGITDDGAAALAEGLKHNRPLESLK